MNLEDCPKVIINLFSLTKVSSSMKADKISNINKNNKSPYVNIMKIEFNITDQVEKLIDYINNLLNKLRINSSPEIDGFAGESTFNSFKENNRIYIINPIKAKADEIKNYIISQIIKNSDNKNGIKFNSLDKINNFFFHPILLDNFRDFPIYRIFPNDLNDFYGEKIKENNTPLINLMIEEKPYYFYSGNTKYYINVCSGCSKFYYVISGCCCNKVFFCSAECKNKNIYLHYIICTKGLKETINKDNERIKKLIHNKNIDIKGQIIKRIANINKRCFLNSTLQSIIVIDEIKNFFLNEFKYELIINNDKKTKGLISLIFTNLLLNLLILEDNIFYKPLLFQSLLIRFGPYLKPNNHNSAYDFLRKFITYINEELINSKKNNNIINFILFIRKLYYII